MKALAYTIFSLALAVPGFSQTPAASDKPNPAASDKQNQPASDKQNPPAADSSNASSSSRNRTDESTVSVTDRRFMTEAAVGGLYEVQAAQLAQKNAQSDAVKGLAQQIEKDHTTANDELKSIAQQRSVELPTSLDAQHQAKLDKLSKLNGAAFDKAYASAMVKDHRKDVTAFERASKMVVDSSLRGFAEKTLPHLRHHLEMARSAQSGKSASAGNSGQN